MSQDVVVEDEGIDLDEELSTPGKLVQKFQMRKVDPDRELEQFQSVIDLQKRLRPLLIGVTRSQDWKAMGGSMYLQSTGMERQIGILGIVFGRPEVERENFADGTYAYHVSGPVYCQRTGVCGWFEGGRWSGQKFFADQERLNPLDVRKSSVTNWRLRGVTMLAGLRGLTLEDVQGRVAGRVEEVSYDQGGQGGVSRGEGGGVTLPHKWGSHKKGDPMDGLSDQELRDFVEYQQKSLNDPDKQRYRNHAKKRIEQAEKIIRAREDSAAGGGEPPEPGSDG